MASESRTFGASRSKAPFAGSPSWPSARLRENSLLFSASAPAVPVGVAVALFLPAHATAARSRPGCARGSIPPVAGLAGGSRPAGSTPTSRLGTVARRPSTGAGSALSTPPLLPHLGPESLQTLRSHFDLLLAVHSEPQKLPFPRPSCPALGGIQSTPAVREHVGVGAGLRPATPAFLPAPGGEAGAVRPSRGARHRSSGTN